MTHLIFHSCDSNMLDIARNLDLTIWDCKVDIWADRLHMTFNRKVRLDFDEDGDLILKPSHDQYGQEYWLIDAGSYSELDIMIEK